MQRKLLNEAYKYSHSLTEYKRIAEELLNFKLTIHNRTEFAKIEIDLQLAALNATTEFAILLGKIKSKGFEFSHGPDGEISDICKIE